MTTADTAGEMTLYEHLSELRIRVTRIALALVVGTIVGYIVFPSLLDYLIGPYCAVPEAYRETTGGECALVATTALEPFSLRIKTSVVFGAFITGPVIFWQLWRFIAPGLTRREKRLAAPFVFLSQLMFALGILFASYIIPLGLNVLLNIAGPRVEILLGAGAYLSFLLTTSVAFGLVFELPLVLVFMSLLGIVTSQGLRRFRPYALVLNVVLAAFITPTTDAITLFAMAGPMALFYEASIVGAWFIERSRRKRA